MEQPKSKATSAGGVTVLCFLAIMLGQLYLLRNLIFASDPQLFTLPYLLELLFWIPLWVGIVVCWIKPAGWTSVAGCVAAFVVFGLYAVVSIIHYSVFSAAYLTGFNATYASAGGGLVGLKLVLALVGVVGAMPVAAPIDNREYSRRLREKVEQQNAQWAAASVKGAKADLDNTLHRLKETLSPEEMESLLAQLNQMVDTQSPAQTEAPQTEGDPLDGTGLPKDEGETSVTESWHGWGCG